MHTQEEAQVFVHDLNLFATVQSLEETPAVLSLGKLCEDHGYSYEWVTGQKQQLTKDGKTIICKTDNFVPLVVPGLPTNSGSVSSSTSPPQDSSRRGGNSRRSASSSSSGPVSERSDEMAPGNRCDPSKTQNKNIKRDDRKIRTTCWQIFGSGWWSSQIIWRTQNCMHPHTVLRIQIRNILRKWQQKQGSTVFTLSKRPKLRSLLENQNDKGSLQKTHWRSSTSSRKVWWLDDGRSQSSSWGVWIKRQSPVRCRGSRSCHSMDWILSVQNKDFPWDGKKFVKILGAVTQTTSHVPLTIRWYLEKHVKI